MKNYDDHQIITPLLMEKMAKSYFEKFGDNLQQDTIDYEALNQLANNYFHLLLISDDRQKCVFRPILREIMLFFEKNGKKIKIIRNYSEKNNKKYLIKNTIKLLFANLKLSKTINKNYLSIENQIETLLDLL